MEGTEGGEREGKKQQEKVYYCLFSSLIIFFTWLIDQKSFKEID